MLVRREENLLAEGVQKGRVALQGDVPCAGHQLIDKLIVLEEEHFGSDQGAVAQFDDLGGGKLQ